MAIEQLTQTMEQDVKPERPRDMMSDVIVPYTQNIAGGAACGIALWLLTRGAYRLAELIVNADDLRFWSITFGALVAVLAVAYSSFIDEGRLSAWYYRLGKQSRQAEIDRLALENAEMREKLMSRDSVVLKPEDSEALRTIYANARRLIEWHYSGTLPGVPRERCKRRGMGDKAWTRARKLLKRADAMDEQFNFQAASASEALDLLDRAALAIKQMGTNARAVL